MLSPDEGVHLPGRGIVGQFDAEVADLVALIRFEVEAAEHVRLEIVDDLHTFGS